MATLLEIEMGGGRLPENGRTMLAPVSLCKMVILSALVALMFPAARPCVAQEEISLKLSILREKFEKLKTEALVPQEKLDARYTAELEKLEEKAAADAQLDLVLAVQAEATAHQAHGGMRAKPSEHAELANLQRIYSEQSGILGEQRRQKIASLIEAYRKQLEGLVAELTREEKIAMAVAAREELGKLAAEALAYAAPVKGRYVRVQLPKKRHPLSLAEIEVLSAGKNVALEGTATQSSTGSGSAIAARAIDGNTNGDFRARSTTHTKHDEADAWWELDLGAEIEITKIVVWNRTDSNRNRLDGFKLSVLGRLRNSVWEKTFAKAPERDLTVDLRAIPSD